MANPRTRKPVFSTPPKPIHISLPLPESFCISRNRLQHGEEIHYNKPSVLSESSNTFPANKEIEVRGPISIETSVNWSYPNYQEAPSMGGSPALNVPAKTGITLSKRKTEAVLVRTYLKYQSNDQFCYVCENGYHKASDCEYWSPRLLKIDLKRKIV